MTLGFYTTLVLEGAEKSLAEGRKLPERRHARPAG